jgi:tocopherol O-methyltransferase
MPTVEEIRDYYADMTAAYIAYGDGTEGWHMGLWGPGVTTRADALLASNRRLLDGLPIDAHSHILDVGCGVGGLAIWAARTFGCRVTSITLVPMHVVRARMWAALAGVRHLCTFERMDMAELPFADATFDVVTNQESWCHTADKRGYLRQVYRVLRPGGCWRALDAAVREQPLPPLGQRWHREICAGWHIFPWPPRSEVERMIRDAGYLPEATEDLTEPATVHARTWLGADARQAWAVRAREFVRDPPGPATYRAHMRAGRAFAHGLTRGYFEYLRYGATKPAGRATSRGSTG